MYNLTTMTSLSRILITARRLGYTRAMDNQKKLPPVWYTKLERIIGFIFSKEVLYILSIIAMFFLGLRQETDHQFDDRPLINQYDRTAR